MLSKFGFSVLPASRRLMVLVDTPELSEISWTVKPERSLARLMMSLYIKGFHFLNF